MFGCQRQPQVILADVYQVGKAFYEPQDNQNIGKRSDGDAWIALFETGDGTGRRPRARGEIRHGDSAPQTGAPNILAEPFESGPNLGRSHGNNPYMTNYIY